ncbi:MAG: transglutaminase-like domain-containing protein [Prosthecobacter sp.]
MNKFRVKCELDYETFAPLVFLLNVRAQDNESQKVLEESFSIMPQMPHTLLTCAITQNRFDRITAELPGTYHIRYEAVVESALEKIPVADLPPTTHEDFGLEQLPFLYPSRYCQSDRIGRLAFNLFGHLETPVQKVQGIIAWISENVAYTRGSTTANTSAMDTLVDHAGVCRDFAHLGIALCRALNIPARYFTGYAFELEPPDFHACFETWIGGRWMLWDATHLSSPDSVVRIGMGQDAADVSVCTSFGSLKVKRQKVVCEYLSETREKMSAEDLRRMVVCHEVRREAPPAPKPA